MLNNSFTHGPDPFARDGVNLGDAFVIKVECVLRVQLSVDVFESLALTMKTPCDMVLN